MYTVPSTKIRNRKIESSGIFRGRHIAIYVWQHWHQFYFSVVTLRIRLQNPKISLNGTICSQIVCAKISFWIFLLGLFWLNEAHCGSNDSFWLKVPTKDQKACYGLLKLKNCLCKNVSLTWLSGAHGLIVAQIAH